MKSLIIILIFTFCQSLQAKQIQYLYTCVSLDENSKVYGAYILEQTLGKKKTYHVQVNLNHHIPNKNYLKKVYLTQKYDGRILTFGTGNFRIRIDKVRRNSDSHFSAFARIPAQNIHSQNWSCKNY